MSKKYFKDIQIIKICRLCGVEFMPWRNSWEASTDLCSKHRYLWYKERYKKSAAYDRTPKRKAIKYKIWLVWIKKNWERRRLQALTSYHRHKSDPKNKARRHRTTKKPLT